jgi:peptidoglycan/xylan/chitin deacetylase (PgdA/CDA1 family)
MVIHRLKLTAGIVIAGLCIAGFGCASLRQNLPLKEQRPVAIPSMAGRQPQDGTARPAGAAKVVYLTFDADMTPAMKKRLEEKKVLAWYDPALIEYLRKEDVAATVFVTGMFAELYPSLITDLAKDDRFSIQNHSYDHSGFESPCYGLNELKSDDQRRAEITKTQDILHALTGKLPTMFRFPGLCKNAHDDATVISLGLKVNDGNLVSGDAFARDAARIAKHVVDAAVDGSVVVMHLGGPNAPATAEALRMIVPSLRAKGFNFAALR